jgi:hypothetical protein
VAKKLANWLKLDGVIIKTAGKTTYNSVVSRKKPNALQIAVESYLQNNEDKVIFVIDSDSDAALAERRKEPYSYVSQIERITNSDKFRNKVFLAMAVQELEAWLLTDCVGVCCYFVKTRYTKEECREKIATNEGFLATITKYQKGNTELIVEPLKGGRGAKEHLVKFSEEVLKTLNPKMKHRNIDANKYREALSPEIADHIEISKDSLQRNKSLLRFGELLE